MDVSKMRNKLSVYCDIFDRCELCPIDAQFKDHKCGRGTSFLVLDKKTGEYEMCDDEIIEMYSFLWPEEMQTPLHSINEEEFLKMLFDT